MKQLFDSIPHVQFQHQTVEQDIQQAISRITGMNESPPCTENQVAIQMLEAALFWLNERTRKRKEQGVEGTNKPHLS